MFRRIYLAWRFHSDLHYSWQFAWAKTAYHREF